MDAAGKKLIFKEYDVTVRAVLPDRHIAMISAGSRRQWNGASAGGGISSHGYPSNMKNTTYCTCISADNVISFQTLYSVHKQHICSKDVVSSMHSQHMQIVTSLCFKKE